MASSRSSSVAPPHRNCFQLKQGCQTYGSCSWIPSPPSFPSPSPSTPDSAATPASLGPALCGVKVPERPEWAPFVAQSDWSSSYAACNDCPGWTVPHVVPALGYALHMMPALADAGPVLHHTQHRSQTRKSSHLIRYAEKGERINGPNPALRPVPHHPSGLPGRMSLTPLPLMQL